MDKDSLFWVLSTLALGAVASRVTINAQPLTTAWPWQHPGGLNAGLALYRAWAVRDGDSAQAPEPSSVALLVTGLLFS
jgi:hypothetical protein